mgnify:FL=1
MGLPFTLNVIHVIEIFAYIVWSMKCNDEHEHEGMKRGKMDCDYIGFIAWNETRR